MNVIQWKRLLLSPKKAMRRLRSMHFASAHETSPTAAGAEATASAASWAPATAATAARSVRRLIRLVVLALGRRPRARNRQVACRVRVKPPGQKKFWSGQSIEWSYVGRACRNSRSVIEINSRRVVSLRHDAPRAANAPNNELAACKTLGNLASLPKSLRIAAYCSVFVVY